MNNAVFAKSIDNLIKRENVKLVNDKTKLSKLAASPSFDSFRIFFWKPGIRENAQVIKLYQNRLIYVGFTILDLSNVILVYQFHYEYMKKKYALNAKLLFTVSCYTK